MAIVCESKRIRDTIIDRDEDAEFERNEGGEMLPGDLSQLRPKECSDQVQICGWERDSYFSNHLRFGWHNVSQ
jgi:hypothetical protein